MLFRMSGRHYLTTGIGYPFIREEQSVDSRGRTRTNTIYADHGYLSIAWSKQVQQRGYGYGHRETITEVSDLTVENGIYSFTVNYREYETRQGERGDTTTYYQTLPTNARLYIHTRINEIYDSVMKEHFPNMRSKESFFENISPEHASGEFTLNPETLEEVFGPGIKAVDYIRAQEEICKRLSEFYNEDLHKPQKFKIGDITVPKWMRSSGPHGFHFAIKSSVQFRVSLKLKFAKDILVTPTVSQRSQRIDSYRKEGNYVRTSHVRDVTLRNVLFKATLPERLSDAHRSSMGAFDNSWTDIRNNSNTEEYHLKVLAVTSSGTKARPKRGAWQGPYTGISTLKSKVSNRTYVEYISEYGMPNCESSLKNFKSLITRNPQTSIEDMDEILTPIVDISPIELGHVNLYRLGNPMYELKGTRLNDYLVPSLKDFVLSISEEKVLTIEPEHQVDCVGNDVTCKEVEQGTLPPGSYLVKVKDFCNKHHDANRPEYNTGMGAHVNLQITTRNVLRVIKVHDGQIREDTVEFVGAEEIATSFTNWDTFDERW